MKKKKIKKSKIGEPQPYMSADVPYVATLPPYLRSDSNLGHYEIRHVNDLGNDGAISAPLPNTDCNEEEFRFPRFDSLPTERRSTAPEPHPQPLASTIKPEKSKDKTGKMKRGSSLNPIIRPRRSSVIADTSENHTHKAKLPPTIIRGPSYSKELASGVFPRRMEVNDGGQIYVPPVPAISPHYPSAVENEKENKKGKARGGKSPDSRRVLSPEPPRAETPMFGREDESDPWRLDPILTPQPLSVDKNQKGGYIGANGEEEEFTALPAFKSADGKRNGNGKDKEKGKKTRKGSKGKGFGGLLGGKGERRVVCAS